MTTRRALTLFLSVVTFFPSDFVAHSQEAVSQGWVTAGANPQRTSWVPDAAPGALEPLWRSDRLPGMGWHSWWPVIYRDVVLFTRTEVEEGITPYHQTHALFQAKAQILRASREELAQVLDTPLVPAGDLFYIQNLIGVLDARPASSSGE
jgi:hypothetical protein